MACDSQSLSVRLSVMTMAHGLPTHPTNTCTTSALATLLINNMPKLVGKAARVVEAGGLAIDELAGNVASRDDTLSIARVVVSQAPSSEPWLTLDYDEWICVLKGRVELHHFPDATASSSSSSSATAAAVLTVQAGETCFVAKGERFRPVFPVADTEYVAVCLPAFKPERCLREEEGGAVSEVSTKLRELHDSSSGTPVSTTCPSAPAAAGDQLYHMCQKSLWDQAIASGTAYFPPTFEQDGYFTHATAVPARLMDTANHFYTASTGDWICLELSLAALKRGGIVTRFEEAKPVGETGVGGLDKNWQCPHIFGGIPSHVVTNIYKINRNDEGKFISIEGLTE